MDFVSFVVNKNYEELINSLQSFLDSFSNNKQLTINNSKQVLSVSLLLNELKNIEVIDK